MKKQTKKFIIILLCILTLTGCTKTLKDSEKNVITNPLESKDRAIDAPLCFF